MLLKDCFLLCLFEVSVALKKPWHFRSQRSILNILGIERVAFFRMFEM